MNPTKLRFYAQRLRDVAHDMSIDLKGETSPVDVDILEFAITHVLQAKGALGNRAAQINPDGA